MKMDLVLNILYFSTLLLFMRRANLLFPALIFLNDVHANQHKYVGNPIAQVFSIEEHQSGNQIWAVDQYIDGRMLFATGNELATWDGEHWQRSSTPNNTRIRAITIWDDDKIYAGAVGELSYFSLSNTGEFNFTLIPTEHLLEDFGQTFGGNSNDKIVVFSTQQAVFVWDGKQIQKINQFRANERVFRIGDTLQIIEKYYPQFLNHMGQQDKCLPKYVRSEFEEYLKCGRLEYGVLRLRCEDCHHEQLVAFSCKRRGFCPSCGAKLTGHPPQLDCF
jgi:ribosomal protein S27E